MSLSGGIVGRTPLKIATESLGDKVSWMGGCVRFPSVEANFPIGLLTICWICAASGMSDEYSKPIHLRRAAKMRYPAESLEAGRAFLIGFCGDVGGLVDVGVGKEGLQLSDLGVVAAFCALIGRYD